MADTFKVIKNINESFSITLPAEFVANPTNLVKFNEAFAIDVEPANFLVNPSADFSFSMTLFATPTLTINGISEYIYSTSTGDCNLSTGDSTSFSNSRANLFFGDNSGSHMWKTWIPFLVSDIAQGTTIVSARLILTDTKGGSHLNVKIRLGCDNRDNCAVAPTNYADLNSRSMTAAYTDENPLPPTTDGYGYLYDVTTAVQEIINRTGWLAGYALAILEIDNGSSGNSYAKFASFSDSDYRLKFPITGISYSGSVVTLTCANYFLSGNKITVSGVNSGYSVTNIDGSWTCDAGTNSLQVIFTVSSPPTGTTPQTTSHGYVSPTVLSVTGMSYSTKTVTLTVANNYNVGTRIHVAGVNSGYSVTNIDGDWVCKIGTSVTQVVFDVDHNPGGTTPQGSSHGTITRAGSPLLVITV